MAEPLLPTDVEAPLPLPHEDFVFEVLGPEHNESDLEAWSTSIDHIHASPGWPADGWPERVYSLAENLADLREHRDHHLGHLDFAWTVLDAYDTARVLGCVYLKSDPTGEAEAEARSWVRAEIAHRDRDLRAHLAPWFATAWPLKIRYASAVRTTRSPADDPDGR